MMVGCGSDFRFKVGLSTDVRVLCPEFLLNIVLLRALRSHNNNAQLQTGRYLPGAWGC